MDNWQEAFTECEYDAIVLGTGMKECLISGLLSVEGKKVLHLDRNKYYGGACSSLQLKEFFQLMRGEDGFEGNSHPTLGRNNDFAIDLVPKFILAGGQLIQILVHADVAKYLEFKGVNGAFVYRKGTVAQVPTNAKEALGSPLMSMMEKTRAVGFFGWVNAYDHSNPKTHVAGTIWTKTLNLDSMTAKDFFKYWELEADTIEFVAHACALHQDEAFMAQSARDLVERIQLYKNSFTAFADLKSPFLYPCYGLGELPQAFARLAAVYGGTYMLQRPVDGVVYDPAGGHAVGVEAQGVVAKAKLVIGDPSYFKDKVKTTGHVVRAMAILDHAIPGTEDADSCQVIIPQRQVARNHDIYVFTCSSNHHVCPEGRFLAFASTTIEGDYPAEAVEMLDGPSKRELFRSVAERELGPALEMLHPALDISFDVYDYQEPLQDGTADKVFISKSYDATSHFESEIQDVLDMYQRITGKPLDLKAKQVSA